MDDNLVSVVGAATWGVCAALTSVGQVALQANLDQACAIPAGCSWERRAAAHADPPDFRGGDCAWRGQRRLQVCASAAATCWEPASASLSHPVGEAATQGSARLARGLHGVNGSASNERWREPFSRAPAISTSDMAPHRARYGSSRDFAGCTFPPVPLRRLASPSARTSAATGAPPPATECWTPARSTYELAATPAQRCTPISPSPPTKAGK
jgi:hypothetical protein